jgi:alginate O-acetyltransferase complex protein AlgI
MLFNSIAFGLFFPIVTLLYFMLPYQYRWMLLLAASCFFYMFFKPVYILILFFTIVIDYYAGILIENADGAQRKFYLMWSLIANVGVLAIFKYYNFLNDNMTGLLHSLGSDNPIPYLSILLPIGLSFHTFQAMSYTIEVYRGNQKAERHFGIYALYVMFYPQLVAGPIERPQNILHQFYEKYDFSYERAVSGLRLMLMGFFKKVVIADRMALVVNQVYNHPHDQNGLTYLIATYFFTIQIYCDFSGYSDIARGCARVMGYELMLNFNMPYISRSIQEFWSRWHISLSTWFRDYLYIPLGGNKVSKQRWYFNLFIVFLISGLWHGASWNYVIWGALHGLYLVLAHLRKAIVKPNPDSTASWWRDLLDWFWTFHLVVLTWVFFRAATLHEALHTIHSILTDTLHTLLQYKHGVPVLLGMGRFTISSIAILLLGAIITLSAEHIFSLPKIRQQFYTNRSLRLALYFIVLYSIIFLGYFGETQFIYFQF